MSFGFSVRDIVLCTQIAYRLFPSVTEGRKKPPGDLKELGDALFGLNCALNHLKRDHEIIIARIATDPGNHAGQEYTQLSYMINSCQETLKELDDGTFKHGEAAPEIVRPGDGTLQANLGGWGWRLYLTRARHP